MKTKRTIFFPFLFFFFTIYWVFIKIFSINSDWLNESILYKCIRWLWNKEEHIGFTKMSIYIIQAGRKCCMTTSNSELCNREISTVKNSNTCSFAFSHYYCKLMFSFSDSNANFRPMIIPSLFFDLISSFNMYQRSSIQGVQSKCQRILLISWNSLLLINKMYSVENLNTCFVHYFTDFKP